MSLNENFLATLTMAFETYLQTSARSNEKLKILHAKIATDLTQKLGNEFEVKSYGVGDGKEESFVGRYYDKAVDISVLQNGVGRAGVAVKFVMSNYAQNANNYFEGMLGETANLRSNGLPYFQILIVPESMPYFKKDGSIDKIEELKAHHLHKYLKLFEDNVENFFHTPNKTLLVVVKLPEFSHARDKDEYKALCSGETLQYSQKFKAEFENKNSARFEGSVIFNDYERFLNKLYHSVLAL